MRGSSTSREFSNVPENVPTARRGAPQRAPASQDGPLKPLDNYGILLLLFALAWLCRHGLGAILDPPGSDRWYLRPRGHVTPAKCANFSLRGVRHLYDDEDFLDGSDVVARRPGWKICQVELRRPLPPYREVSRRRAAPTVGKNIVCLWPGIPNPYPRVFQPKRPDCEA